MLTNQCRDRVQVVLLVKPAFADVSGFLAGLGMASGRQLPLVHPISFALIMTSAIYLTIDLEYPRAGFIRVDNFEDTVFTFSRGT